MKDTNCFFIAKCLVSIILGFTCVVSCNKITSPPVDGVVGEAGQHSSVLRDTQGNEFGFYEYLPLAFNSNTRYPLLFYWNGGNAISGNGREELAGLLTQGLPQNIANGKHYPLIIISAQLPNWKKDKVKPFVDYIIHRYRAHIDGKKIYMTGFSAGGGITTRFALNHPETLAAIVPVAPALHPLRSGQLTQAMAKVPSRFFHNAGDDVLDPAITQQWFNGLKALGGDHQLTIYDAPGHYAWQTAYDDKALWQWLLAQRQSD